MNLGTTFRKVFALLFLSLVISISIDSSFTEALGKGRVDLEVSNTVAYSNSSTEIAIKVSNPIDTILGFRIWLRFDKPEDVIAFRSSGQKFDTVGTLTAGWQLLGGGSVTGTGSDIQISGIANTIDPPFNPGILPQNGGTLIKILADVKQINDPYSDSTVGVSIDPNYREHLEMVIKDFSWEIWIPAENWDTVGWVCNNWLIDSTVEPPDTIGCTDWQQTPEPPWDYFTVLLDTLYVLDTTELGIADGSIEILPPLPYLCGDINSDGTVGNILDLNYLVNRIFRYGPDSDPPEASDLNCDGGNGNVLDLNILVNRIFRGGLPVCSSPSCN